MLPQERSLPRRHRELRVNAKGCAVRSEILIFAITAPELIFSVKERVGFGREAFYCQDEMLSLWHARAPARPQQQGHV